MVIYLYVDWFCLTACSDWIFICTMIGSALQPALPVVIYMYDDWLCLAACSPCGYLSVRRLALPYSLLSLWLSICTMIDSALQPALPVFIYLYGDWLCLTACSPCGYLSVRRLALPYSLLCLLLFICTMIGSALQPALPVVIYLYDDCLCLTACSPCGDLSVR